MSKTPFVEPESWAPTERERDRIIHVSVAIDEAIEELRTLQEALWERYHRMDKATGPRIKIERRAAEATITKALAAKVMAGVKVDFDEDLDSR
jgi:hypothetical protein